MRGTSAVYVEATHDVLCNDIIAVRSYNKHVRVANPHFYVVL